ncbi:hypothetical protein SSX86_005124 [Deinandra increscens subsp. villosa]|uniref:Uncharacterized protein n=1 Tax=Deinandra increscens subsp. villosa TaxID=3103831 RepID=A0AAP0DP96_9ASTR
MDVHESDRSSENLAENNNNDATNRHGKSKSSSWGLSTAVHAVHGVGFVAKKVVNNRYTDSLWHSKKTTSTPSVPSDAKKKRENHHSNENVNLLHTSQSSSSNVADEQTSENSEPQDDGLHARLGTVGGSNVLKTDNFIESQPSSPNKSCVLALGGARDSHTPIRSSSPPKSAPLDKETGPKPTRASRWLKNPLTTTRGFSPIPTRGVSPTRSREVSPTPSRGVSPTPTRDVSPTSVKPSKPSGRRHFFNANIISVFTKMVDNKKEKDVTNLKEVAQHLELLYNIQVQWQFANASAEAALDLQRATAEKSLFGVWRTIFELRDSLASKKVDMELMILKLKLYAVIYRQMAYIDEWASIQKEHELALFATTNDLQARSLSVPITGGVKADIRGLKLIVFSSIQVLQATISCIQSTLSKLDKTHFLASELANLVLHERALLDECELFLASAAPLHIEECSLLSYLLQSSRTSMTE